MEPILITFELTPAQAAAFCLLERTTSMDVEHKAGDLNDYARAIVLSNVLTLPEALTNMGTNSMSSVLDIHRVDSIGAN